MVKSFEDCIRCFEVYRKILKEINIIETEKEYPEIRWEAQDVVIEGLDALRDLRCLSGSAYEELYENARRGKYSTLPDAIEKEILKACRSVGKCQGKP